MSAHTPGPWRIERPEDELIKFGDISIGARPTVEIWADGKRATQGFYHPIALVADNDVANARLIAAAPDLLAAAQRVLAHLNARLDAARDAQPYQGLPVFDGIADLHDAVNKATGAA